MRKEWRIPAVRPTLTLHWVNDLNPVTCISLDWGQCTTTKVSL